jgi:hypothetical protein
VASDATKSYLELGPGGPRVVLLDDPKPDRQAAQQAQEQEADAQRQSVTRRRDAVVDAARTLDDLSPDGVRAFVTRRWAGRRALEEADVESFAADAREQRIHDVVDSLDSRVRGNVFGRVKHVRVDMPRGWARASLRSMTSDELETVIKRLADRGWDQKAIDKATKTYREVLKPTVAS